MRLRRGGSDRLIRRLIAGTVLLAALLLGGRSIGRAWGGIQGNDYRRILKAGGQWLVETIWNQTHPGERMKVNGYKDVETSAPDPDPSYRKYREVRTFYQEHQYLAWYGNEETGQQTWEDTPEDVRLAGASGPEYAGGGSNAYARGSAGGGPDSYGQGTADGGPNVSGQGTAGSGPGGGYGMAGNQAFQVSGTLTGVMDRPLTGHTYVMEQLMDYDFLMKHFYSVHTSTTAGRDLMDARDLLGRDMSMKGDSQEPQILIYHTHSQEAYADSGPGQTVVGVGDCLTELLEKKGYNVYHDKSVYDLKNGQLDRSKAYNYALDGITNILQQNPSIEVVLDIHRDGVGENLRLVTQVDGKDTAQIMFFNGMSQTPEGPIEYLQNPNREDNLAFSLQMQLNAAAYYPGFTRKIYLKGLRYNEHVRPKSSLIEVGAQTNTYQEALNAMEPLSELLDMVLSGNGHEN